MKKIQISSEHFDVLILILCDVLILVYNNN